MQSYTISRKQAFKGLSSLVTQARLIVTMASKTSGSTPTTNVQAALCVLIPEDTVCFADIQDIRSKHDKAFVRWPPHVNLIFPYLHDVEPTSELLQVLQDFDPFEIEVSNEPSHFKQRNGNTVHLKPDSGGVLEKIQGDVCKALNVTNKRDFHPHLTLAQFAKADTINGEMNIAKLIGKPFKFECNQLTILIREKDTPFRVHKTLPLGKKQDNTT
eukprot:m.334948 g.334948  ORF g.334948 m.334948 type:complete len:215 (+) comp17480_c0_seq1:143-787(+)